MSVCIFTDLDDTLFQTAHKTTLKQKPQQTATDVTTDGSIKATFMLDHQREFYRMLHASGEVIAVTGRDLKHFSGLHLPEIQCAVLNHGASLAYKENGVWYLDTMWHQQMLQHSLRYTPILHSILTVLQQYDGVRSGMIVQDDLPVCTVSKVKPETSQTVLQELAAHISRDFDLKALQVYLHLNGNNLSFIPNEVQKATAVRHLQHLKQPSLSLGVGDSHSDMAFMRLCDYWITPSQSQICGLI